MGKLIDITGQKFGRLLVIERSGATPDGKATWRCKCDCGNECIVSGKYLRGGNTKSCGCLHKEQLVHRSSTHKMTSSRLYRIWHNMISRCSLTSVPCYPYYGGRGIAVCTEWKESFEAFNEWSLHNGYDDSLTLDRINNDGNYSPDNCRWVTMKEQCKNRRRKTKNGSKQQFRRKTTAETYHSRV